jgi:hypothetical protein
MTEPTATVNPYARLPQYRAGLVGADGPRGGFHPTTGEAEARGQFDAFAGAIRAGRFPGSAAELVRIDGPGERRTIERSGPRFDQ